MLRFILAATRGYRLDPWNSPYLKWRIETYWGVHADHMTGAQVRQFMWTHRRDMLRFLRWASAMQRLHRA